MWSNKCSHCEHKNVKKTLWVSCVGTGGVAAGGAVFAGQEAGAVEKEEKVLRTNVEKHRQGLLDVLRQEEEDAQILHQRIQVFHMNKILVHCLNI